MANYDFSIQKQLFEIAYQILEDYEIEAWSFGGGTALSYCYYRHRMSYDIDIFLEDYSAIAILLDNKGEIARNYRKVYEEVGSFDVFEVSIDKIMKPVG